MDEAFNGSEAPAVGLDRPAVGVSSGQSTLDRLRKRREAERAEVIEDRPSLKYQARELDLAAEARRLGAGWLVAGVRDVALGLAPMPVRETDPDTGEERLRPATGMPTASDRLKAYSMIKVWGWGKEIERVSVDATVTPGAGPLAIDSLSADDMVAMLDMARAARGTLAELPAYEAEFTETVAAEDKADDALPDATSAEAT